MKKKILALLTALTCTLSVPVTAFAADPTYTDDGSASIHVSASVTADYTIQLPAALTLADADGDGLFEADGTVGVKGTIPVTKAVIVVPSNGATDDAGNITAESAAAGTAALNAVTTENLSALTGSGYAAVIKMKGTDVTDNMELDADIVQDYVRFASPYFAGTVATKGEIKMNSDAGTYATSPVKLTVTATEPDTYDGTVIYTFKMVNRS